MNNIKAIASKFIHSCVVAEVLPTVHEVWQPAVTQSMALYSERAHALPCLRAPREKCLMPLINDDDKICSAHISTLLGAQGGNPETPGQAPSLS